MAVLRIDHLAIAVKNLDEAVDRFTKALGAEEIARKKGLENNEPMEVAYLRVGDSIITLISSDYKDGFIAKFLDRRGEGMHHLALETDDLDGLVATLQQLGINVPLRAELPGRKEIVLSPREFNGVVLQIIQWSRPAATIDERIRRIQDFEFEPAE